MSSDLSHELWRREEAALQSPDAEADRTQRLVDALHVVACLVRSPEALANVLEAAGQVALERAGTILDERVPE